MATATIIECGNFGRKEAAELIRDALHGKTYMNFQVDVGIMPGGARNVDIRTDYEEDAAEIAAFALRNVAMFAATMTMR